MFWGLIMEPGRCYTQKVKVSFHVSMAALDISNSSDDPAQVMCVFEGRNYLLCTLNKKDKVQCPLDLNFEAGSKVSFATNGKAHVHLTGYLTNLEDDYFDEEVVEEEEVTKKDKKRLKKESDDGPPSKKSKAFKDYIKVEEAEDDTSDSDSDFELHKLEGGDSEDEDVEGEEAVDDGEDEDEGEEEAEVEEDEEDEEDASSLSDEESEEEEISKPKQNGVAKTKETTQKKVNKKVPKEKLNEKQEAQQKQKKTFLRSGVIIQDLKEGNGEPVKQGKFVHVYYEGRLKNNNMMFDATTKGPGFSFRFGKGEVIKGWDIGLVGMKVGGKRRIICPPKVAYGSEGSPPVIPPNATLVFDVEIKKVG